MVKWRVWSESHKHYLAWPCYETPPVSPYWSLYSFSPCCSLYSFSPHHSITLFINITCFRHGRSLLFFPYHSTSLCRNSVISSSVKQCTGPASFEPTKAYITKWMGTYTFVIIHIAARLMRFPIDFVYRFTVNFAHCTTSVNAILITIKPLSLTTVLYTFKYHVGQIFIGHVSIFNPIYLTDSKPVISPDFCAIWN